MNHTETAPNTHVLANAPTSVKPKKKEKLSVQSFVLMFLAGIISAIGVTMFLAPAHLYDSGISGTSMLLYQITPEQLTFSLFLVVLNVPLFLFGLRKQGTAFTIYSVFAVIIFSLTSMLIEDVLPIDVGSGSPFAGDDVLLCALFGGLICGIGSGLSVRFGGAIDGIEVLAVIFSKQLGLTVGTFIMIYNICLYTLIGCIFQSWTLSMYSIVTYCVAVKAIDFIAEGLDKAKSAMIVTSHADEISNALSEAFGTGITHIDARGYYSGRENTIVFFVVNRFQIARLKKIVTEIDRNAFITITEVSDVLGRSVKTRG